MSSLRDLARQRLREMGQPVGQGVGQAPKTAVPPTSSCPAPVGQDFPQTSVKNDACPTVPLPKGRDSGTRHLMAGTNRGTGRGTDPRIATATQREWRAHLEKLDGFQPLGGIDRRRWWHLYEDACWLFNEFGEPAARDGWSGLDLFGVLPCQPGWGGLADRLRGARNLKLADGRARWTHGGRPDQWNRGSSLPLIGSGLVLMWEIPHAE